MLSSTIYTMSSMEAAKEDKTCRCELKMQTFMCSCAQWYAWTIFSTSKVYTKSHYRTQDVHLKLNNELYKEQSKLQLWFNNGKIVWRAFCSIAFFNALLPFNIVDFFYVVSRIFYILFYCFINQQKAFRRMNGGKIADQGLWDGKFCG